MEETARDVIAVVVVVAALASLARRSGRTAPLVLVAGGVLASLLPFVDEVRVSSDGDEGALGSALEHWLAGAGAGSYLGIHAWLPAARETTEILHDVQARLRDRTRLATTFGYGPRFLHSTGQLHKGGPDTGRFLQIVDEPEHDLEVPETDYTFGTLIRAQADGDRRALEQRGRRVMRVNLGSDVPGGLARLRGALGA